MFFFTLAFLLGDLYLQTFPKPPSKMDLYLLLIVAFLLFIFFRKRRLFLYAFAFLFGFIFSSLEAYSILSWNLPKELEGKPLFITGKILSLPVMEGEQARFLFSLEKIQDENEMKQSKTLIQVTWRNLKHHLRVGEKWQLFVRLKRIHGAQNPGSFDYEAWSFQKGLRATGYVLPDENKNIFLSHHRMDHPIDHLRENLQDKIQILLSESQTKSFLIALLIGERTGIKNEDWEVLRKTGTNHLMAIAGLHVGMIFGMSEFLFSFVWRRFSLLILFFL